MKSLADTTELMEKTTSTLMSGEESISPKDGIALIDQWIVPLSESENTQPIAEQLRELKELLADKPSDSAAIIGKMGAIAAKVMLIAPDMGAEGEMPSLLAALSAALRMGATSNDPE